MDAVAHQSQRQTFAICRHHNRKTSASQWIITNIPQAISLQNQELNLINKISANNSLIPTIPIAKNVYYSILDRTIKLFFQMA